MRRLIFLAAALLSGSAAWAGQETVTFTSKDGCSIEASYMQPSSGAYIFINTHGLGSDRNEWGSFQKELGKSGFGYLSLDLRGHGGSRSCAGKRSDYRKFTRQDWANASRDINAAAAWLGRKGFPATRLIFCGASVGANLSLKAAAESRAKPAALILLSPGLDYAGIKPETYLGRAPERLLIVAAGDDPYAWRSAVPLYSASVKAGISVSTVDGISGHGADMLKAPEVTGKVVGWAAGPDLRGKP